MTHIDAMKQGLGALEVEDMACRYEKEATPEYIAKAIASLRQAIAEAEKENALQSLHAENERLGLYKDAYAEPVIDKSAAIRIATALGWEPKREWVGLTEKEIDQGLLRTNYAMQTAGAWRDGVEWAQSQLKEKNT